MSENTSNVQSVAIVAMIILSLLNSFFSSQQSQLSHYPERKITEFQQNIDALEKEYKKFIAKLRVLDPSCKHKPWTPRPYCKRRGDSQEAAAAGQSVKELMLKLSAHFKDLPSSMSYIMCLK